MTSVLEIFLKTSGLVQREFLIKLWRGGSVEIALVLLLDELVATDKVIAVCFGSLCCLHVSLIIVVMTQVLISSLDCNQVLELEVEGDGCENHYQGVNPGILPPVKLAITTRHLEEVEREPNLATEAEVKVLNDRPIIAVRLSS